jgi:hypothetical protein
VQFLISVSPLLQLRCYSPCYAEPRQRQRLEHPWPWLVQFGIVSNVPFTYLPSGTERFAKAAHFESVIRSY